MGPDEDHEAYPDVDRPGLDNNTYTNVMVVWVLRRALEALEELPPHYRQELSRSCRSATRSWTAGATSRPR